MGGSTRMRLPLLLLALLWVLFPARAFADDAAVRLGQTAKDPSIVVSIVSGNVRITAWDRVEVRVSGDASVSSSAEGVHVHSVSNNVELSVPAASRLEIHSTSGNIMLEGVTGRVRAASVDGSIEVVGTPTDVEARSVSGSVAIKGARGEVRANTVSGRIDIDARGSEVSTRTVSGPTKVAGGAFARLEMQSVSGSLECDAEPAKGGSFDLHSHSGSVRLTVPKGVTGNVEVRRGHAPPESITDSGPQPGGLRILVGSYSGEVTVLAR
jgi:Putative adhesin